MANSAYTVSDNEEKWQPTPELPGKIPWTEKPGRFQSMGLPKVGHDLATKALKFAALC